MRQEAAVFISYSSNDEAAAETVCRVLEQKQIGCWLAKRDLRAGEFWDDIVPPAVVNCCAVVLILSSHANRSKQVKRELHIAFDSDKVVIPLRIEEVHPDDAIKYIMTAVHWLDAFEPPLETHLGPLIERVTEIKEAAEKAKRNDVKTQDHAFPDRPEASLRVALLNKPDTQPDDHVLSLLEKGLRAAGHEVFIDRHLNIGVEWAREIGRQIEESDAVIPILSAASVESDDMLAQEIETASKAAPQHWGRPRILPVRVNFDGNLPEPFFSILGHLQPHLWRTPADDDQLLAHMRDSLVGKEQPLLIEEQEPGGADIGPNYIERAADPLFCQALDRRDSIVLVKGARQMGKTSLLARGLRQARKPGTTIVLLDLQRLNQASLADIESLYKGLAEMIADQLELDIFPPSEKAWRRGAAPSINFQRYIRSEVLDKTQGHLVLAFDEVDRLFEWPHASEVFGLFRSWHNERQMDLDPKGLWKKLTLAIVYATEPHLFISNQNQSPFNVGTQLALQDFNEKQVGELNRRYNSPLRSGDDLARFFGLFNGQPYLTRRGFFELTSRGTSLDDLVRNADSDNGPFGDHLRRILFMLGNNQDLKGALRGLLQGEKTIPDETSFYRLRSGGLMIGSQKDAQFRCAIYEKFLARHLV